MQVVGGRRGGMPQFRSLDVAINIFAYEDLNATPLRGEITNDTDDPEYPLNDVSLMLVHLRELL